MIETKETKSIIFLIQNPSRYFQISSLAWQLDFTVQRKIQFDFL